MAGNGCRGWIPVAAAACQEKLVPGVEVLWPQRLLDLTPEQSRAEWRAAKVEDEENLSRLTQKKLAKMSFKKKEQNLQNKVRDSWARDRRWSRERETVPRVDG